MNPYYFDWAATAPMSERSLQTYLDTARTFRGNPSALHKEGIAAAQELAKQRKITAELLGFQDKQVYFTSGATESNAIVLQSLLWKRKAGRIIFSALEHDSILQYRRLLQTYGFDVRIIGAPNGYVSLSQLQNTLTDDTQMVCIMLVNNVLGTVQDIEALASVIREHQKRVNRVVHFHCDAVQALGKIPWNPNDLDIDSASFSAHKFQGPKGTGILYQRNATIDPLSRGGNQEMGVRPGTEHLAAIAAMNVALRQIIEEHEILLQHGMRLRRIFEEAIAPHASLMHLLSPSIDTDHPVTPFIITCAVPGVPSEVFTRVLYDGGFCVSSGSACSNNAPKGSDSLLTQTGFSPREASGAIRISFGQETTEEQMHQLCDRLITEAKTMTSMIRKR